MNELGMAFIACLMGYLLGSIPFGLILTKLAGLGDIRSIGSGNIGATNVLRTGKKGLALATLLLDGGKGAIAVLIARFFEIPPMIVLLVGGATILGHLFPLWLGFKGGKGVATTFGTLIAIHWQIGLAALGIWLLVAFLFRYSSLASISSITLSPLLALLLGSKHEAWLAAFAALLIWISHRENIGRLINGAESKIGQAKK